MFLFPHPRSLFFISLALAIPTYGISLLVFYFLFKRPFDSKATSLILAKAKGCLASGLDDDLFSVNSGATARVFSKFSVPHLGVRYGTGTALVRWGVLIHPMINGGKPFTLRITKEGGGGRIKIEAVDGEDWRYLKAD